MPFIAGAFASMIGGGAAQIATNNANSAALGFSKDAIQQYLNAAIPDPQEQALALQKYQQTGQLDPRLEQAVSLANTQLSNVHTDPGLQGAQMNALNQLQQEGLQGGLTLQDQATLQQQENNSATQARGQIGAIQDRMQQQGMGGSGLGLQAQLAAAQGQNQTNSQNSLQAASDARSRAMQAIGQSGQLAGQMAGTQYQQQANVANAQDAINRFNTTNQQNVGNSNVATQNQAQQYNLNLGQQISNANTNIANQQQQDNKDLYQQQFQNQMQQAQGVAGADQNMANAYTHNGAVQAAGWTGMGHAVNQGLNAYGQYQAMNPSGGGGYHTSTVGGTGGSSGEAGGFSGNQGESLMGNDQNSLYA